MSRLLEVYDEMQKEAEFAKVAEEVQFMFEKYAELANEELAKEYGSDYTDEDVQSLTEGLMEHDASVLEEHEKFAEYEEIGREMARQYIAGLEKEAAGKASLLSGAVKKVEKFVGKNPMQAAGIGVAGGLAAGAAGGALLAK